jgi:hypothetical protein
VEFPKDAAARTVSHARGPVGNLLSKVEDRQALLKYLYLDKVPCCILFLVGSVLNFRDPAKFNKPSIPKQYAEHYAIEIFWPYPKNLGAGTTQKCKIEKNTSS